MSEELVGALQRIVKGSGLVLAGTLVALVLNFFSRVILARVFTVSEYGVFNLAMAILSFFMLLASMGLPDYVPREISYYRVKDPGRVKRVLSTSVSLVLLGSIIGGIALYMASDPLSAFLHEPRLSPTLKILSFSLPFQALLTIAISIFRGFGRVREKVYFQNITVPTLWLASLLTVYFLGLSFTWVFLVYVVIYALSLIVLLVYIKKSGIIDIGLLRIDVGLARNLLALSLPLLFTSVTIFVMNWSDTLMIGYFKGSRLVGVYNAAAPLARLLTIFIGAASFMFLPVVSELYARGLMDEVRRLYQVTTKWLFVATVPLFALYMLFPKTVIALIFGEKYVGGFLALRILSMGFMFHVLVGLNGLSLVVLKETRFIALYTLASAVLNIALNTFLIPAYNINGAAAATAASYILTNIFATLKLYKDYKVQPFYASYVKTLLIAFILLAILKPLAMLALSIWGIIFYLFAYLVLLFSFIVLSRSVDEEDVILLKTVGRKLSTHFRQKV